MNLVTRALDRLRQRRSPRLFGYEAGRLRAALGEEGCPTCRELADHDASYFFWYFNESCCEPHNLDALERSLGFCRAHAADLTATTRGAYQLAAVQFIQGSIMEPSVRWRLRHAWGLCDRHAWGAVVGEAVYRHGYLHGPALLYEDLMSRAIRAFEMRGPSKTWRIAGRLRETGPCLMCEMDLRSRSGGAMRADVLREGRDPRAFQRFAARTDRYWRSTVCGRCDDPSSPVRCRIHFREDVLHRTGGDVEAQHILVERIVRHLVAYARSFVWGHRGTETDEDRAALISAVGWCSGWRGLMAAIGEARMPGPDDGSQRV